MRVVDVRYVAGTAATSRPHAAGYGTRSVPTTLARPLWPGCRSRGGSSRRCRSLRSRCRSTCRRSLRRRRPPTASPRSPLSSSLPGPTDSDGAALRLFLGGVGQHDAAGRRLLGLHRLDHHAIIQRTQLCILSCLYSLRVVLKDLDCGFANRPARVPRLTSGVLTSCRPCRPCRPCHPCRRPCRPCHPCHRPCRGRERRGRPSFSSVGISVTSDSVVSSREATLAAFCRAMRTTFAGSMMPAATQVAVGILVGVVAVVLVLHLADAIDDDGAVDGRRSRRWHRSGLSSTLRMISTPSCFVALRARACRAPSRQRISATPPPGTMPSSKAACVAALASSSRALRSFISVSVAAPPLIWATPPASLASRSCSFSRSYSLSVDFDLAANLLGPAVDVGLLAAAADDRRVLGVDVDLLGPAQVGELDRVERDAQVLEDRRAAGQRRRCRRAWPCGGRRSPGP